jgi:hypothetical protein
MKPRFDDAHLVPKKFYLTPNNIERLEACPASRVYRGKRPPKHEGAKWGDALHKFIEIAKTQGTNDACEWIDETFPRAARTCYSIDVDSIPEGDHEVDQYIDPYKGEVWLAPYDVKYMEHAVFGRFDFEFEDATYRAPHVVDWKAGKENKVDPATSIQLRTYATGSLLRARKAYDAGERSNLPVGIPASIVNIHSNGDLVWRTHVFHEHELDEHAKRLRRVHLITMETRNEYEQEGVQPEFVAGEQCKWCDLRMSKVCAAPDALPKEFKKGWK